MSGFMLTAGLFSILLIFLFSNFYVFVPLHIRWSTSYYNYNSNNNNNNKNNNQHRFVKDDKNGNGRQCGRQGEGGDNNWYMGMGECIGTNVAYSLFGILPSDSGVKKTNPCMKKTFINSFYTTDGLRSFALAGDIDITAVNQACTSLGNGYSTTLGCSASGEFEVDDFYGYDCNGLNYNSTIDTLDWLNSNFTDTMHCSLIYKNDGSLDYATQLLTYSMACNLEGNNKNFCPDPFGMLKAYEYNFAMARQDSNYTVQTTSPHDTNMKERMVISAIFVLAGVFLLTVSVLEWWDRNGRDILACRCGKLLKRRQPEEELLRSEEAVYA